MRSPEEVRRTPVLLLTDAEVATLDPDAMQWAMRARAQNAREIACPEHEPYSTATELDVRRGYHPARCRLCGMAMDRDSSG